MVSAPGSLLSFLDNSSVDQGCGQEGPPPVFRSTAFLIICSAEWRRQSLVVTGADCIRQAVLHGHQDELVLRYIMIGAPGSLLSSF